MDDLNIRTEDLKRRGIIQLEYMIYKRRVKRLRLNIGINY